jgi:carbon storage regulator
MLVLSRKINESIVIGGGIRITVTLIRGRQVRVAIEAPQGIPIHREELLRGPARSPSTSGIGGSPAGPA